MSNKTDPLGDRMKGNYENRTRYKLTRRTPVIIRLDGKAFHTITKNFCKPFDISFGNVMSSLSVDLCSEIQGAKCAYTQSDEISILITDFDRLTTDAWFDYNLQKMVSISSAMASVYFAETLVTGDYAFFDSRAFNMPKEEVANYFIWRQKDWIRNSVSMLAQANFSHKQLQKKGQLEMKEMLEEKGICWDELKDRWKYGTFVRKIEGDWDREDIVFTDNRDVIEQLLIPVEE